MVLADHNVTVDDSDGSITYSAGWSVSAAFNSLDYGGFHHLSDSTTATATFTFVGTAVYVMCPLWPYAVGAQAAVDGSEPVGIDMQDHSHTSDGGSEDIASTVLWRTDGLSNSSHTLQISFWSIEMYVALDAIIYTVQDSVETSFSTSQSVGPFTPSSSSFTSAATGNSNSDSVSKSSSKSKTGIIAGAVVGAFILASLIISLAYCINRRRGNQSGNNLNGGPPRDTSFIGSAGSRGVGSTPSMLESRKSGYLPDSPMMLPFPTGNQIAYANGPPNTRSGAGGADVLGPNVMAHPRTSTSTSLSFSGYSPGQHGEISQYRGVNRDLPDPVARSLSQYGPDEVYSAPYNPWEHPATASAMANVVAAATGAGAATSPPREEARNSTIASQHETSAATAGRSPPMETFDPYQAHPSASAPSGSSLGIGDGVYTNTPSASSSSQNPPQPSLKENSYFPGAEKVVLSYGGSPSSVFKVRSRADIYTTTSPKSLEAAEERRRLGQVMEEEAPPTYTT
ncbi:hypothetical protein BDP27DRAFT_1418044 [Rhodocollybia butyracea]|uniref:Transmembrane protein n=1 Tax=Rhodocollybia butyracea TaxID=206335 RepID=A0A9P5PU44_9AGAR|nr:hypothetical protein BDP27DRAFT_1418044 [Rhodocollybia butyracea]